MGVPAFFRWLSRKYTSIVVHCVEERGKEVDGVVAPIDTSQKNPNDVEFDNLYLDMNGIIHPCCHPENKPAPQNEDEMMVDIFAYIDRIFNICRPRKLLYMAIDGVAPRAKMNQQRSRRFRASKESVETSKEKSRIREEMLSKGYYLPPEKPKESKFDSNCITPGTPFMFRLAECLRFYIHDRLNNDPGWANIKVILSDANVPGEGEHKIMDYIRRQRAQPDHDPNTHHCLCGADADLIMLGLATHEPNFTIIREEFKPNQPKPCDMCGQMGHEMQECTGLSKEECDKPLEKLMGSEQEFIFIRLPVLREHLQQQLRMDGLPFEYNFERALDDWVFMCFFVGNDFLPHLPSLEIREGAIDRLVNIYKQCVYKTGGYLTDSGVVNLSRVQYVLSELGKVEDEIFKTRRVKDLEFRRRERNKKLKNDDKPRWMLAGQYSPAPVNSGSNPIHNPRQTAADMRRHMHSPQQNRSFSNFANASSNMMHNSDAKRKYDNNDEDEDEPEDDVKLWEDGWKDRYYKSKFNVDNNDIKFRHQVANHYVRGLCWVLRYYYQGCASWKWYFPYHYAPFASDFINIGDLSNEFEKHTQPFKPLEQLMGVFPAASRQFLPPTWQCLMTDDDSPIIDFYPTDFKIDLNGKKYAWQGVALLPFVDETRLKAALATVYDDLSEEEKFRNIRGNDRLFVSSKHPLQSFLDSLYEGSQLEQKVQLNTKLSHGMGGAVWCDEIAVLPGHTVFSPLPQLKDLNDNQAISVYFNDPTYSEDFLFPAKILPNAIFPPPTVKPDSYRDFGNNRYRPQLGFQRDSGYRDNKDVDAMVRMIRHNTSSYNQQTPSYNDGRGRNPGVMIPPTVETYGSARGGYMGRSGGNWHGGAGGSGNFGKGNYYGGGNRGGGSNYGGNRGGWGSNRGGYNNPNDPYKRNRQGGNQWEGGNNWNSGGYRSRGGGGGGGGSSSSSGGGGGGGGNQYHRGYY